MADIPELRNSVDTVTRERDGTFAPGKSPNPGGQAKWLQPIKAELRAGVPGVLKRLASIIANGSDRDATAAGKVWLEYSLPKPRQAHKVEGVGGRPLEVLTSEQLVAFVAGRKDEP
jgi:hypothetical protein